MDAEDYAAVRALWERSPGVGLGGGPTFRRHLGFARRDDFGVFQRVTGAAGPQPGAK